jgi:hypothetical protein
MTWYYISFASPAGFQGGLAAEGVDALDAITAATAKGVVIPDAAEAMAVVMPEENLPALEYRYRLLSKEDVDRAWGGPGLSIKDAAASGRYDMEKLEEMAITICPKCLQSGCRGHE